MPTPPPPTPAAAPAPVLPRKPVTLPSKSGASAAKRPKKTFSIGSTSNTGGDKILVYSFSGGGKTTLAAQLTNAIFIAIDDGVRKITNPITGEPIQVIQGLETWQDIRDALNTPELWPAEKYTIVIDTLTKAEELCTEHILETVRPKGVRLSSFRQFGWDGDRHIADEYRLLLTDLDPHVAAGNDVVLLCQQNQISVANAEGSDYLQDVPYLNHRKDVSVLETVKQWCDLVARIGYIDLRVAAGEKAKAGKVTSTDNTRAVFTSGALHYTAKSRPVHGRKLPDVVSFADEQDNSLWLLLSGAVAPE